ncbi:MAG: long-chain-acyl-CoA synthetase [Candidatus Lokiarchaeota archaeon]|nr:long-chain-acyl-CoA synthetase [Candidatus Lokiarchaeota archaeon]
MSINTIPDKLPKKFVMRLNRGKYDDALLFTLAVFGPHKLKELINDSRKGITDRMDEVLFREWKNKLKTSGFIEEYKESDELYLKATEKGKDELLSRVENSFMVRYLKKYFSQWIGPVEPEKENKSKSPYVLSYRDVIFGFLSVYWRLCDFFNTTINNAKAGPDDNVSLGIHLEYNAEHYSSNAAIYYEDVIYTYKEFNEITNQYANYLLSLGVTKGEVINIFVENRPELLFLIGAMSKIGSIGALINTKQRSSILLHSLTINPVKIHIIGEELIEPFEEIKSELGLTGKEKLFFLKDKGKIEIPEDFIELQKEIEDKSRENPSIETEIKGKDTYVYIFTSGTTGLPKAAHIRNMYTATSINTWGGVILHMTPDDIMYISLPLFHSNALHLALSAAIGGGSAVAIARRFSVRNFWKDIKKFNATCFNYIGEICRYLFNQPTTPEDRNHRVYKICGNGLSPEIWKEFKERFGIKEVYEHYGMTEMWGAFVNYLNLDCTVGYNAAPYAIVKYNIENNEPERDKNGFLQRVEEGQAGLLIIQAWSDYVFAGYTDKKASEKKIFYDAFEKGDVWMNAGDLVRNIGYKHAQFVDRLGDTFRWKGENVSTTEVEDLISSFEEIDHASVYGVEIPGCEGRAGMASILATVKHDKFDFNNFVKTLQDKLPNYALPIFIRFLSELNTTSTYKIQKYDMKKIEFNIKKTNNPIYVYLPKSTKYTLLTEEIYENILNGKYRF